MGRWVKLLPTEGTRRRRRNCRTRVNVSDRNVFPDVAVWYRKDVEGISK